MKGRKPKPKPSRKAGKGELNPPAWLSEKQKEIWHEAVNSAPVGLLCGMDRGLLGNWVVACDLHRDACEKVVAAGLIVKSPKGGVPMQNPYLPIINKQAEIMMRAAAEMGFTPISRARLANIDKGDMPEVLEDEPKGKKQQAEADAVTAQVGTDWADILPAAPTQ